MKLLLHKDSVLVYVQLQETKICIISCMVSTIYCYDRLCIIFSVKTLIFIFRKAEQQFDQNMEKTTNCLGIVSDLNDRIPMMQIKLTALLPGDICVSVPNTMIFMGIPLYRVRAMVFQQYFGSIVVVSFIVIGNRSTRRKPTTWRQSLRSFIT